VSSNHLVSKA